MKKKNFGKRQLLLGALIVSLGAAVYLNWQFSGSGDIPVSDVSVEEKELGKAQLVNGTITESEETTSESAYPEEHSVEDEKDSEPIDSETVEKDTPTEEVQTDAETVETDGSEAEDFFMEAGLNRQKTRDQAIETLNGVLSKENISEDETRQAVEQSSEIARNMLSESNIESLVKSKGYTDCVAFLQDGECSLVVGKEGEFSEEDAAVIKDIVVSQSEVASDHIKIVDHNTNTAS